MVPSREQPLLKIVRPHELDIVLGANFYSVGRGEKRDIKLLVTSVSRYHAHLYRGLRIQRYTIADGDGEELRSTMGTWVNGIRLEFPRVLTHGDRVAVGAVEMVYLERENSQPDPFDTIPN